MSLLFHPELLRQYLGRIKIATAGDVANIAGCCREIILAILQKLRDGNARRGGFRAHVSVAPLKPDPAIDRTLALTLSRSKRERESARRGHFSAFDGETVRLEGCRVAI
jgi:hypothetical protein